MFLGNTKNKCQLSSMLLKYLQKSGIAVEQSSGDADTTIVNTAIKHSEFTSSVIVVGEDVDLLILLVALVKQESEIYFAKPSHGNVKQKSYPIQSLRQLFGPITKCILFLHAATGCDTTSAPFRLGKKKAFNMIRKDISMIEKVDIFNNANAIKSDIIAAGESFLMALYGAPASVKTLDGLH
jgi:hypothetical protein